MALAGSRLRSWSLPGVNFLLQGCTIRKRGGDRMIPPVPNGWSGGGWVPVSLRPTVGRGLGSEGCDGVQSPARLPASLAA
jgi:hypothetical protein